MLGWLLLAVFGIIWAAFLFPSWRRSPTSSVEDFEQRMNLLAEANKASPGRWVLVPRKGRRFLGHEDRQRARLRRRRKYVFLALLDLIGLTLLMGLFQPLRGMLVLTAFLGGVLILYVGMLLRFQSVERAQLERRRAQVLADRPASYANGNGNGNGNGHADGYASYAPSPNGNGHDLVVDEGYLPEARYLADGGIQIIDEDVHVIVRRSDEVDLQALRAANGVSAE
jgi:hypothetical protein